VHRLAASASKTAFSISLPPPCAIMTSAFQPRPAAPMVPPRQFLVGLPPERPDVSTPLPDAGRVRSEYGADHGEVPGAPDSSSGRRDLARIGALVSDQARCQMLLALGDGRALPAGVLAAEAGVTAATASSHLHKLTAGGLLTVEVAGRRRNYRLAGPDVGALVEALERLAPALPVRSLEQSQRGPGPPRVSSLLRPRRRQARRRDDACHGRAGLPRAGRRG